MLKEIVFEFRFKKPTGRTQMSKFRSWLVLYVYQMKGTSEIHKCMLLYEKFLWMCGEGTHCKIGHWEKITVWNGHLKAIRIIRCEWNSWTIETVYSFDGYLNKITISTILIKYEYSFASQRNNEVMKSTRKMLIFHRHYTQWKNVWKVRITS